MLHTGEMKEGKKRREDRPGERWRKGTNAGVSNGTALDPVAWKQLLLLPRYE
jgi:hypothetical protein